MLYHLWTSTISSWCSMPDPSICLFTFSEAEASFGRGTPYWLTSCGTSHSVSGNSGIDGSMCALREPSARTKLIEPELKSDEFVTCSIARPINFAWWASCRSSMNRETSIEDNLDVEASNGTDDFHEPHQVMSDLHWIHGFQRGGNYLIYLEKDYIEGLCWKSLPYRKLYHQELNDIRGQMHSNSADLGPLLPKYHSCVPKIKYP